MEDIVPVNHVSISNPRSVVDICNCRTAGKGRQVDTRASLASHSSGKGSYRISETNALE